MSAKAKRADISKVQATTRGSFGCGCETVLSCAVVTLKGGLELSKAQDGWFVA
jgi:hypothetical protein